MDATEVKRIVEEQLNATDYPHVDEIRNDLLSTPKLCRALLPMFDEKTLNHKRELSDTWIVFSESDLVDKMNGYAIVYCGENSLFGLAVGSKDGSLTIVCFQNTLIDVVKGM